MSAPAPVIAIDGPSGAGKGTVSRAVAQRLGWHLLDSGALYRLTAMAALRDGVDLDDERRLAELARGLCVRFEEDAQGQEQVFLRDEDVTARIRSESCGEAASRVAVLPEVRASLIALQRSFRRPPGLVADGRDMGTHIFPDAGVKIFLTASDQERARRRHKQLKGKGISVSLPALSADIGERDARDTARTVAPLRPADDAMVLDTTDLDVAAVVEKVVACVTGVYASGR